MIKDLWNFLVWQWQRWQLWQRLWIVGAGFFGAAIVAPDHMQIYLFAVPVIIVVGCTFKWWLWDSVRASYAEYRRERDTLLDRIRDS